MYGTHKNYDLKTVESRMYPRVCILYHLMLLYLYSIDLKQFCFYFKLINKFTFCYTLVFFVLVLLGVKPTASFGSGVRGIFGCSSLFIASIRLFAAGGCIHFGRNIIFGGQLTLDPKLSSFISVKLFCVRFDLSISLKSGTIS